MTINKSGIKNIEKIKIKFNSLCFTPLNEITTKKMFELADKICEKFNLSGNNNILIERDYKIKSIHFNNGYFRLNFEKVDENIMKLAQNLGKKSGFSVKLNKKWIFSKIERKK